MAERKPTGASCILRRFESLPDYGWRTLHCVLSTIGGLFEQPSFLRRSQYPEFAFPPWRAAGLANAEAYAQADAAASGFGIAYVPEKSIVAEHLRAGPLKMVLSDRSPKCDGYFLCFPIHRQNLRAVQIVVDALRHRA